VAGAKWPACARHPGPSEESGERRRALRHAGLSTFMYTYLYGTAPRERATASPDAFSFRSGVTTMVDAGTCGWKDFPDFKRRIIEHANTRVLAMLNTWEREWDG